MGWFNYYGLIIMVLIMIPNIVYAVTRKDEQIGVYRNKNVVIAEQIGRYGCFVLMIFNIPYTYFNFWFDHALTVYLSVNGGLLLAYVIFWIVCWKRRDLLRALSLSILPTIIFLFSGVVLANIPLLIFAVIFGIFHILISCKTIAPKKRSKKTTRNEKWGNEAIVILIIVILAAVVLSVLFGQYHINI